MYADRYASCGQAQGSARARDTSNHQHQKPSEVASIQPPPLSLSDKPTDTGDQTGRKGDHYVDAPCASLAWSFVKNKTALSPSGSLNASVQASPATHATGGDAPPPIPVKTA